MGYLFSMVVGFYLGRKIEARLLDVSIQGFPLAQKSEAVLTVFKEMTRLQSDAVMTGDPDLIDNASAAGVQAQQILKEMADLVSKQDQMHDEFLEIVDRLKIFSDNAAAIYRQLSQNIHDVKLFKALNMEANMLARQSEALQAQLERYTVRFSQGLKDDLADIRYTSRQQRFFNLLVFIAVVICSVMLMAVMITRSIIAPLRKTLMLEKVTEQFADGITVIDLEGNIVFANRAWGEMHGYDSENIVGRQILLFHTPNQFQHEFLPIFHQASETGLGSGEIGHIHKDGRIFPTSTVISQMLDEEGHVFGMILSAQDITEQKRKEQELKQAKQDAEAANTLKSMFLANMSHEIRTPLNGVMGVLNLLLSTHLDKEQLDLVQTGKSSADNLLTVISDILDFSKIEAGKLEMEELPFDLRNTVQEVVELPAINSHSKGLEFICFIQPDVPSLLIGDPGRLRQIILNLTNNAIKFTTQGEIVLQVSLESESDTDAKIKFEVRDTGIGISKEKQHSIFEAFQQTDTSTTRLYGGTGLGLSISSKLVEMLNGEIGIESEQGRGAIFWFTALFVKQSGVQEPSVVLPDSIAGKRILIVDDNKTNLDVLAGYLSEWGCGYDSAQTGAHAIDLIHAVAKVDAPFDAAIIDMLMPGMDGLELGKRIRSDPALKDIKMVMLTALGLRGDAARMKEVGYDAFLTKPIRRSQLLKCLKTLFSHQRRDESLNSSALITKHSLDENARKNIRILLVEDNSINQKIALRMLEKFGFSADLSVNGKEALEMLERFDYHIVLMDRHMPVMDGLEATRTIRSDKSGVKNHNVPIIALTATAMKGDKESCIEAGMDDYVPKPIEPEALLAAIERFLPSVKAQEPENDGMDQPMSTSDQRRTYTTFPD